MKICYLLETTDLWGGVRVVFDQARGLIKRGHDVVIRALTGSHAWYSYSLPIEYVRRLDAPFSMVPDVVICTYWTTVTPGAGIRGPQKIHFCQGYEGDFSQLKEKHSAIEESYRMPIPKITNGGWISKRLKEVFGKDLFPIYDIGQVVDTELFRPPRFSLKNWIPLFLFRSLPPKILISGDYRFTVKGVADALHAVAILRGRGEKLHIVRVSSSNILPDEHQITPIDEFHVKVPSKEMASIYRKSDIFIAPSHSQEGFGLPFAEALASGVPSVATRIPSFLSFDDTHDYALFVDENDPEAIATGLQEMLHSPGLYKHYKRRGPYLIQKRFHLDSVAQELESILKRHSRSF